MENPEKSLNNYCCVQCDYCTVSAKDYNKHILTRKHQNRTKLDVLEQNIPNKSQLLFECECGKNYTARNSLWYHKKKCALQIMSESDEEDLSKPTSDPTDKELMMMILKDNSELKNIIMEVVKNGTMQNSHNTTTSNSHNKAFNLQFFLNETCKDAMNITEFVESIKLQLSDLERVGELGYVEGISSIIVKNLKDLDVTQRPVHCTDKKRETMYVKDQDKWEKDEEQKKMHKLVRKVADKNARMLPKFKEAHPDCIKSSSRFSDQYNTIIIEAMGGRGDNDFEKEEKIIKRVSKEVTVEKEPPI
jgi:hypothetical protein